MAFLREGGFFGVLESTAFEQFLSRALSDFIFAQATAEFLFLDQFTKRVLCTFAVAPRRNSYLIAS
jgi:hypothetical protein